MADDEGILVRDIVGSFAPGQGLRAALLLTYSFDGKWLEEGFIPDLFDRPVATSLVLRDQNSIVSEASSVRYHRANARFSTRVFHPKLALFVAEDRALAIIASANLTRGGLERNLELGSAFEVSGMGGPRSLFNEILQYIAGPLTNEVEPGGTAAISLRETTIALREVLEIIPQSETRLHSFIHNYNETLWKQVLDALPHRHVARLSIISPFFEPNIAQCEDPDSPADVGIFSQMFKELRFEPPKGEKPINVFFQQSDGKTLLPIDKLLQWRANIDIFQRLTISDDARPLHGKFLLFEGARGRDREPYLLAVSGSPNFTSAAFLSGPPMGNSEIALITRLPVRRNAYDKVRSIMRLDRMFGRVIDWTTLTHTPSNPNPSRPIGDFRVLDATLRVSETRLDITWEGRLPGAVTARVQIKASGAWITVGTAPLGLDQKLVLDVPTILETDSSQILSIRSTHLRVELLDAAGAVLGSALAPINVDCPSQFCGTSLIGAVMSTLDERIAFEGCGVQQTYRKQIAFLEHYRGLNPDTNIRRVLGHQADLDRFFRNLQTGIRGVRSRSITRPNSEYTLRKTLGDLSRWLQDSSAQEGARLSSECRLFLIDRLARELLRTLEVGGRSHLLAPRLRSITSDIKLSTVLISLSVWMGELRDPHLRPYVTDTNLCLASVAKLINNSGLDDGN
ncbi:hypothetical protein [Bradyrhizobium sp. JYMT SZCCT0180]|uniref:hypothetical protein n=1 Tax=Bradyrhizobium sp. JYMT SZCCT0180 TaxID=2807666 RepID=UPI001BADF8E5|nr:hypothetical protein [Bradyrhizobium sp. JYMT SZCCT0180]MBR1214621.1 hypothetical protein [Bradyrhizobium sp. JYMT SZCCT0180]